MMKLLLILLAFLFLLSCAHVPKDGAISYGPIVIPDQPKRVAIEQKDTDKTKYPETFFIKPPVVVDKDPAGKGLYVQAPPEGMVYWNYPDYAAIKYGLIEYVRWMDTVEGIIKRYNSGLTEGKTQTSWWRPWTW